MTMEEYYGDSYEKLQKLEQTLRQIAEKYKGPETLDGVQPVLYISTRIKTPESMMKKMKRHKLPADGDTALAAMHDAVGIRIICSFADDVYAVAQYLSTQELFTVVNTKDYIKKPKQNGYRSLHLIVKMKDERWKGIQAEIQLRTIATDFWAALEHQIKYKRKIMYETVMQQELKRCADEIASLDMSMQTLRDILHEEQGMKGESAVD